MVPVRVLVVDDNPAFLEAEVAMLRDQFKVVGTLNSGAPVARMVAQLKPDVIVLDLSLGDMTGFDVVRRLKSAGAIAKIVFLTIHEGEQYVQAAVSLGVSGYVFKSQAAQDLPRAVAAAYRGKTYFSSSASDAPLDPA